MVILQSLALITMTLTILWGVERISFLTHKLLEISTRIQHLYQLNELIVLSMNPAFRTFYSKLRQSGPITSAEQARKLAEETTAEVYKVLQNGMAESISTETDPIRKDRLQAAVKEFDDIFALYSTVGPDSSQEYIETIGQNIAEISIRVSKMLSDLQD